MQQRAAFLPANCSSAGRMWPRLHSGVNNGQTQLVVGLQVGTDRESEFMLHKHIVTVQNIHYRLFLSQQPGDETFQQSSKNSTVCDFDDIDWIH